jgi:hypothetical protein
MKKKKSATKKPATKKSATRKPTAKKSTDKKTTAKKSTGKKLSTRRSTLAFLTESLPAFTVGRLKKTRIQAVGGTPPYSFGLTQGSSLPAGLGLNYRGILWGKPTQAGDTTIFVKVTDLIGGHLTEAFDVQISSP